MGKIYKAALVVFYLLQLIIVFHEQVMHLFERAASPVHDSTSSTETRNGFLKRLRHAMEQHHEADIVLHSRERSHTIGAVVRSKPEPENEIHKEEKNSENKRQKRKPIAEFLIANLFPSIKKIRSRLAGNRACCPDLSRMITFPSNVEKKAQAA